MNSEYFIGSLCYALTACTCISLNMREKKEPPLMNDCQCSLVHTLIPMDASSYDSMVISGGKTAQCKNPNKITEMPWNSCFHRAVSPKKGRIFAMMKNIINDGRNEIKVELRTIRTVSWWTLVSIFVWFRYAKLESNLHLFPKSHVQCMNMCHECRIIRMHVQSLIRVWICWTIKCVLRDFLVQTLNDFL